jgi:hypothetical protein
VCNSFVKISGKRKGINLEADVQKFLQVATLDIMLLRIFVHEYRDMCNEF